jgi:hypothetical protein
MFLGYKLIVTCIMTSGTTDASWSFTYVSNIPIDELINYFSNPMFESGNTTGWTTYADTTEPPTNPLPDATMVLTANTVNPLHGSYQLKVAKPASDAQNKGFYYDLVIDPADRTSTVVLTFDANTSDSNYTTGAFKVYFYDTDNGVFIGDPISLKKDFYPTNYSYIFRLSGSTYTNYRLFFHWTTTGTTAVALYFDNFRLCSVPPVVQVVSDTDLTSQSNCTITTGDINVIKATSAGAVTSLQLEINTITITGAASSFSFTLPAFIPRPSSNTRNVGFVYDASSTVATLCVYSFDVAGGVTISKASGGTFTGGANNSYIKGMFNWIT